jgi:hypothetical protein
MVHRADFALAFDEGVSIRQSGLRVVRKSLTREEDPQAETRATRANTPAQFVQATMPHLSRTNWIAVCTNPIDLHKEINHVRLTAPSHGNDFSVLWVFVIPLLSREKLCNFDLVMELGVSARVG